MSEKNMSCEMRVVFAALSIVFLLTALFGQFFAIIGFILTAFVAVKGKCAGAKILGPAFCKKSVTDAISKASDELKSAADEAMDKAKDAAGGAVDAIKNKVGKKD